MNFEHHIPARSFMVGNTKKLRIRHCASVELDPDEQLTFMTKSGSEFDIIQKEWGFYATPSLNGRLLSHGLHAVLVRNITNRRYYILLVQNDCYPDFYAYLSQQDMEVITWLDSDDALGSIVPSSSDEL
jgi:hypothetical protein